MFFSLFSRTRKLFGSSERQLAWRLLLVFPHQQPGQFLLRFHQQLLGQFLLRFRQQLLGHLLLMFSLKTRSIYFSFMLLLCSRVLIRYNKRNIYG